MLGNLVNVVVASNSLASEFWQLFAFSPIFLFSQLDPVIEGFPVRTDYLVDSSVSGSMKCLCLVWCDSATGFLISSCHVIPRGRHQHDWTKERRQGGRMSIRSPHPLAPWLPTSSSVLAVEK
jgi:hypothetical protein